MVMPFLPSYVARLLQRSTSQQLANPTKDRRLAVQQTSKQLSNMKKSGIKNPCDGECCWDTYLLSLEKDPDCSGYRE